MITVWWLQVLWNFFQRKEELWSRLILWTFSNAQESCLHASLQIHGEECGGTWVWLLEVLSLGFVIFLRTWKSYFDWKLVEDFQVQGLFPGRKDRVAQRDGSGWDEKKSIRGIELMLGVKHKMNELSSLHLPGTLVTCFWSWMRTGWYCCYDVNVPSNTPTET